MKYRWVFILGVGVGFVLGARAGRERYEQMLKAAQKAADSPAVQQAAGAIQAQAAGLAKTAKGKIADQAPKIAGAARDKVGTARSKVGAARGKKKPAQHDTGAGAGGVNGRPAPDGHYTATPGGTPA